MRRQSAVTISHSLVPHPRCARSCVQTIDVSVQRSGASLLEFRYQLSGDVTRLRLPQRQPPQRADELWRHTCCEAFIARPDESNYLELNFSPSLQWAAYQFSSYREGMVPAAQCPAPKIALLQAGPILRLTARLDLAWWSAPRAATQPLLLGLTAVVEDSAGSLSYWALTHAADHPDFHDQRGFAVQID
jgi:hypothetical protein